MDNSLEPGH